MLGSCMHFSGLNSFWGSLWQGQNGRGACAAEQAGDVTGWDRRVSMQRRVFARQLVLGRCAAVSEQAAGVPASTQCQ
jgi:hypothetical protein